MAADETGDAPGTHLIYRGFLTGHNDWVTKIAPATLKNDMIISASRDKSLLIWSLDYEGGGVVGKPVRSLVGHNHFVSDCVPSIDGGYVISSSWDKTLRLWDIEYGVTKRRFIGHTQDVLAVTFSSDNRQIVSCSRDQTVRLWNTLAVQKFMFDHEMSGHKGFVSSVAMTPNNVHPLIISGGWDKKVKVWSMKPFKFVGDFVGHKNVINHLAISPDGALCASAGKDGMVIFWDLEQLCFNKFFQFKDSASYIALNPQQYIAAVSHGKMISIIDLQKWEVLDTVEVTPEMCNTKKAPFCTTVAWSADGIRLFSGHTDNSIRMWDIKGSKINQ